MTKPTDRPDYLRECLSDASSQAGRSVPIDELNKDCCQRCANRGCARSSANNSLFDVRAREWKHQLFESPPRADENDPNYSNIRSKLFAPAGPSLVTTSGFAVSSEPRPNTGFTTSNFVESLAEPTVEASQPAPAPAPAPPPRATEPQPSQGLVQPPSVPVPVGPRPPPPVAADNAPFQQGAMLGAPETGKKLGGDRTYILEDD